MLSITLLIHRCVDIAAGSVRFNSGESCHRQGLRFDPGCTDDMQACKHELEAAVDETAGAKPAVAELKCSVATKP